MQKEFEETFCCTLKTILCVRLKPYCEIHQADDHQTGGKPTNNNQVVNEPQTNRPMIDEDDEYLYYYQVYTPDQPTLPTPRRSTRNRHPPVRYGEFITH